MVVRTSCRAQQSGGPGGLRVIIFAPLFGALLWTSQAIAQAAPPPPAPAEPHPAAAAAPAPASPEGAPEAVTATSAAAHSAKAEEAASARAPEVLLPSSLPRDLSPWGMFL